MIESMSDFLMKIAELYTGGPPGPYDSLNEFTAIVDCLLISPWKKERNSTSALDELRMKKSVENSFLSLQPVNITVETNTDSNLIILTSVIFLALRKFESSLI